MYNVVAEFVTWLFDLAVSCFFPGASYQRQKTGEDISQCSYSFVVKSSNFVDGLRIMFKCFTAMQLLVAILDVFSVKWQPDKKKGQPPGVYVVLVWRVYAQICIEKQSFCAFHLICS